MDDRGEAAVVRQVQAEALVGMAMDREATPLWAVQHPVQGVGEGVTWRIPGLRTHGSKPLWGGSPACDTRDHQGSKFHTFIIMPCYMVKGIFKCLYFMNLAVIQ